MKLPLQRSNPEDSKAMETGPMGRSVPVPAGQSVKKSQIDGPFGGSKPA